MRDEGEHEDEGGTFLGSARTKGSTGPFNWMILILLYFNITYHDVTGLIMHTGNLCYSK
jgi:hypothetical protein